MLSQFEKDRYFHFKEAPPGIARDLQLTLDEFYIFDPSLKVQRISNGRSETINIESACRAMRKKQKAAYILPLTPEERLNQLIDLPKVIKEKSLYENYWPSSRPSNFLGRNSKLFLAFHEGYKSRPCIAYGGLTEWLYIISGSLKLTLIEPTKINICKYASLSDHENFEPQVKTSISLDLKKGHFVVIPAGWISIREANRATFALGGEMLHHDDLASQLSLFEDTCLPRSDDKDSEIRYMYWFYTIHLMKSPSISKDQLECLKSYLEKWRLLSLKYMKMNDVHWNPSLFIPSGIKTDLIVRDIQRHIGSYKTARKRFHQKLSQSILS